LIIRQGSLLLWATLY